MRFALLILMCLSAFTGCHAPGPRKPIQQAVDPDRRDAVKSMGAAEKEANQQLNKW
jgi:hypothetical protein